MNENFLELIVVLECTHFDDELRSYLDVEACSQHPWDTSRGRSLPWA
jgi:hypothetical protein